MRALSARPGVVASAAIGSRLALASAVALGTAVYVYPHTLCREELPYPCPQWLGAIQQIGRTPAGSARRHGARNRRPGRRPPGRVNARDGHTR